jgi:hypothetical protein
VRTFTGQLLLKMLCMAVFQEVQRAPHQGRNLLWDRHEFWSAHFQRQKTHNFNFSGMNPMING